MRRRQLEHLIRAASAIVESDDVIVIGSAAKLLAGRPKDLDFVRDIVHARLADPTEITRLVTLAVVDAPRRTRAEALISSWASSGLPSGERAAWWRRRRSALRDRRRRAPRPRPPI